jgi:D-alanyl-D-alanine carboxypeptidase (penicillin-binding protein 5/6)
MRVGCLLKSIPDKRRVIIRAAVFAAVFSAVSLAFAGQAALAVSAKAYALVDGVSGRLIEGRDISRRMPMASTTKIMTGLIACESGRLGEVVTVKPGELRVEGSSAGLQPGERLTLGELVYALLLESGNDAANVIASELDGSCEAFAAHMNRRAAAMGLADTHFANPSGLDAPEHYTTAADLARLGALAMKNAQFAKVVGTKKIKIAYNGVKDGRTLFNHNRLLDTLEGVVGIKTGFTEKDGRCLVTCARRGGVTLVAATLSAPDDWNDHRDLLARGFAQLKSRSVAADAPEIYVPVTGGQTGSVRAEYDRALTAALRDGEVPVMSAELPASVRAPVAKGQPLGRLVYRVGGEICAQTPLTAESAVPRAAAPHGGVSAGAVSAAAAVIAAVSALLFIKIKEHCKSGT